MRGIQYQTQQEILQAKKILYEGNDSTKLTFVTNLISITLLIILLMLSLIGTTDQWVCELDSNSPKHDYICQELRKAVNCKTVQGPIRAEVLLNIKDEVKASALAVCPWEIAISELRVCFVLLSIVCGMLGVYAVRYESKKFAELHFQSAIFFGVLLMISSYFDYLSIQNSQMNNMSLCSLKDEFQVEPSIKGEMTNCTFNYYYATVVTGFISSISLLVSSFNIYKWRNTLSTDSL